jgi:hypothetical protein
MVRLLGVSAQPLLALRATTSTCCNPIVPASCRAQPTATHAQAAAWTRTGLASLAPACGMDTSCHACLAAQSLAADTTAVRCHATKLDHGSCSGRRCCRHLSSMCALTGIHGSTTQPCCCCCCCRSLNTQHDETHRDPPMQPLPLRHKPAAVPHPAAIMLPLLLPLLLLLVLLLIPALGSSCA